MNVDSPTPADGFYLELREPTRICIRYVDDLFIKQTIFKKSFTTPVFRTNKGQYLGATKNGTFKSLLDDQSTATQWEY